MAGRGTGIGGSAGGLLEESESKRLRVELERKIFTQLLERVKRFDWGSHVSVVKKKGRKFDGVANVVRGRPGVVAYDI